MIAINFWIGACAGGAETPRALPMEVLYSSLQCGDVAGPAVRPITDMAALRAAIAPGLIMDEPGRKDVVLPPPGDATLLRVDMGERPTAGYALAVTRAERNARRLVLHVEWEEPAPEAIVAQVVTSPCVIIRLPPVTIDEVQVMDRSGRARISQRLTR